MKKVFNPFTMDFDYVSLEVYEYPRNPTENDDNQSNFSVGDEWINTETFAIFQCSQNARGEAMWKCISESISDKNMVVPFFNTSSVTIDHCFGKYPSVTILDDMDEEIMGDVDHVSINRVVVLFDREVFCGKIILN